MKALILAGGFGERLGSLTKKNPKPMILINKDPILKYQLLLLKKHEINEIGLALSYLPKKIMDYFGGGEKLGVKLKYAIESSPLGTSGALNNFKEFFKEPSFVFYGDNITNLNLTKMIKEYKKSKADGAIYLYHEKMGDKKTTPGLVLINKKGFVKEIIENPTKDQQKKLNKIPKNFKFTNSGIYIINKKILNLIPNGKSDFAKQIFPKALEKKLKIYGYREKCYIREVGQIKRYLKAKKEIESGSVNI